MFSLPSWNVHAQKEESASHPTSPFVFGKGSATSDVRGECFAPYLGLMLKSERHKFISSFLSSSGFVGLLSRVGKGMKFAFFASRADSRGVEIECVPARAFNYEML